MEKVGEYFTSREAVVALKAEELDALGVYIHEIKKYPLLTLKDEKELFKRYQEGIKARKQQNTPENLFKIEAGREAEETIARCNQRRVLSIALKYSGYNIPLLDLIQEGNAGLLKAIERFQPEKGYTFGTYATSAIERHIQRVTRENKQQIRVTMGFENRWLALQRAATDLEAKLGRPPSAAEIASEMKDLDENKIIETLNIYPRTVSLNKKTKDNDRSGEVGDFIRDETQENPLEQLIKIETRNLLINTLENLGFDERTVNIIKMRHGLEDGIEYRLEEIGERFGITKERVRQVLERAYLRMRYVLETKLYRD